MEFMLSQLAEVGPMILDRSVFSQILNQQEEKILNIVRKLFNPSEQLPLDRNLVHSKYTLNWGICQYLP